MSKINKFDDFELVCNFENLYKAYRKTRLGKRWKESVSYFEINALLKIEQLEYALRNQKYMVGHYHSFKVYEPKERVIMSNPFRDKIVQHALCDNVLEPILSPQFIYDNYASQPGKGTHFGLDRLSKFMRHYYVKNGCDGWVLKCDVSKFFYNIEHGKLKEMIYRLLDDKNLKWLIDMIIDSTPNPGLPIGNQTSQLFALLYLSGMDHFIKEELQIKYYGRYMDDFYLIHHDKDYLRYCWQKIEEVMRQLGMKLNNKTNIFPLQNGIDFLGFHTYLTDTGKVIRKVRQKSKRNMRRKMKRLYKRLEKGHMDFENILQSYTSWCAHAKHGDTYYLIKNTNKFFDKIYKKYNTNNF